MYACMSGFAPVKSSWKRFRRVSLKVRQEKGLNYTSTDQIPTLYIWFQKQRWIYVVRRAFNFENAKGKVITLPWQSEKPSCNYYQQSEKALIIWKIPLAIEKDVRRIYMWQFCAFAILARSKIIVVFCCLGSKASILRGSGSLRRVFKITQEP